MHFSTLKVDFGDAPSGQGKNMSNATLIASLSDNLVLTGVGKNGETITSGVYIAVLTLLGKGNYYSTNFFTKLNNGENVVGDAVALEKSSNEFKFFLVTERPASDFKIEEPCTITGDFGHFAFTAKDNGNSSTVVEYEILKKENTDIAGGRESINTGYLTPGEEEPDPPVYAIELSSNSFNLTNAAASTNGEVVSTLAIKAKDLDGTAGVYITFSSANDFELVNENVSATIPYSLYYAANSSSSAVQASNPIEVSVTGSGQTTLTQLRSDNLTVKLNPTGSLTSYPAGMYTDTVTISISTDS